jgi:glc operon protein GlcG
MGTPPLKTSVCKQRRILHEDNSQNNRRSIHPWCDRKPMTGASAQGAEVPKRSVLPLEAVQRVVQAAKEEAADHSWACVIAVVDDEGLLLAEIRIDNAAVPADVELAPGKAHTAALFRRPTSVLEEAINWPRPAAITAMISR